MSNKITKKEVKELLGVSDRTIERYVKKGYLFPIRDNGKPYKVHFKEIQVQELKEMLGTSSKMPDEDQLFGRAVKHIVERILGRKPKELPTDNDVQPTFANKVFSPNFKIPFFPDSVQDSVQTEIVEENEYYKEKLKNDIIVLLPSLKPHLIELLKDLPSQLAVKWFLSINEVVTLSGLPIEAIELAIQKKQLKVIKIGSQLRIRRFDLEQYLNTL